VIDAAFGTGFRGNYRFPDVDGAPVLAVDIPSGISGLTSVDQKGFEMGQLAARLLIDRIENRRGPVQKKIITSELVIRGSSSTR